jgi:uridine phosphorylase
MTRPYAFATAFSFATLLAGQAMAANSDTPMTRAQVKAELAEAIQAGNVVVGESSVRLNEAYPHHYATQSNVAGKSRQEVKAELAEAASTGQLNRDIEA